MPPRNDEKRTNWCSDFWQLPELLGLLASHLTHPGDLKVLCLTSKSLREAVMPVLYRRLEIVLSLMRHDAIFLKPNHPVHKHIRQLVVKCSANFFIDDRFMRWQGRLILLLQALPEDRVESLCTPSDVMVYPEPLNLIFARQRALRYLQIGPMPDTDLIEVPTLASLQGLEISERIGTFEDLRIYGKLLCESHKIKELSIRADSFQVDNQSYLDRGLDPNVVQIQDVDPMEKSEIFTRLFGHLPPESIPLQLHRLLLDNQKSLDAEHTLTPYLALESLRELQIHECYYAAGFISELALRFRQTGSTLKFFSLHVTSYFVRSGDLAVVNDFLESFEGLQFLEIRWDTEDEDTIFDASCLEGHCPTLTDLCLSFMEIDSADGTPIRHNCYIDGSLLKDILDESPNLRQVALALPCDYYALGTQGDVGVHLVSLSIAFLMIANVDQESLLELPQLRVLRMLNVPSYLGPHCMKPALDDFATRILARREKPSSLEFLCIGDYRPHDDSSIFGEDGDHGGEPKEIESACYFPGTQTFLGYNVSDDRNQSIHERHYRQAHGHLSPKFSTN